MIVQVKIGECVEFCLLELQGEILGEIGVGATLGSITLKGKSAELEVGQHILEGELVSLKLPFLVLEKGVEGLDARGVVRNKIIFKNRPKTKKIVAL
jgi:hypothetical protein